MRFSIGLIVVIIFCLLSVSLQTFAEVLKRDDSVKQIQVSFYFEDAVTHEPLEDVFVKGQQMSSFFLLSNKKGLATYTFDACKAIQAVYSLLGYQSHLIQLQPQQDTIIRLSMVRAQMQLEEVIVTASSGDRQSSGMIIGKEALKLLQPSSFSDVLELLPGGISKDPNMSKANFATLREVGLSSSDYAISTLGTAFVMDGVPIQQNSKLQSVIGAWEHTITDKNTIGKGVDMRALSTDGIETIEVIRGVPSVVHGDLTNGVISIKRQYKAMPLQGRIKMDSKSKLFYVGGGVTLPRSAGVLSGGVDYFLSAIDPRNSLENFKRLSGSLRYQFEQKTDQKKFMVQVATDYGMTLDEQKNDPELLGHDMDFYKSSEQSWRVNGRFEYANLQNDFLNTVLQFSYSGGHEVINRRNFIQLNRPTAVPNTQIEGDHTALILPYSYIASQRVDGKPLALFATLRNKSSIASSWGMHRIMTGIEFRYEKNMGDGHIYDMSTPPSVSLTAPPRPFKEIPALQHLALFVEDDIELTLGAYQLNLRGGVRTGYLPGMSKKYKLSQKWYCDPRVNIALHFPSISLWGNAMDVTLGGGIGVQSKSPVLNHLYPDPIYYAYNQLNYFHPDESKQLIYQRTYRLDPTNYRLDYAQSMKKELRLDIAYKGSRMEINYFREKIADGFRSSTDYKIYDYRKYDASNVNDELLNGPPDIEALPFENHRSILTYGKITNGSMLRKEGVEFQWMFPRFRFLNSRFTVNGSWLRSHYCNSQSLLRKASQVIEGKELSYLGVYADPDGYKKELFTSTFIWDSHLPQLGMNISLTAQCAWSGSSTRMFKTGIPTHYIDINGTIRSYTETERNDPELQWLSEYYNNALFDKTKEPLSIYFNLKASKRIYRSTQLALFVTRFMSYTPDYESNGYTVRRHTVPYFGMELNINI